ncbi:MAG: DISARM system helicase DrmA [Planctomycetaceae bacterium]|nr:DISARM system helicase DrmA [Planctomycetaceae bacterium]
MTETIENPSPSRIRAELEEMVINDLLGPASGDEEEITERCVRDRYLAGILAPNGEGSHRSPQTVAEDDDEDDVPTFNDTLADGELDDDNDGKTDADVPVSQGYIPSSFGMSFCVDTAVENLQIEIQWGQYKREVRREQTDSKGNPLRVWKRYPKSGSIVLSMNDKAIFDKISPVTDFPDVYIKGRIRTFSYKKITYRIVTVFLVNGQIKRRPKDECHLFQPKIIVCGVNAEPVFVKRVITSGTETLEEQIMATQYRKHVEFAVGHGVGVHVTADKEHFDRAVKLETAVIPNYEVPATTQPNAKDTEINPAFAKLQGLELDMKLLADADAKTAQKYLLPLVAGYRDWIDREEKKISEPDEHLELFHEASIAVIQKCRETLQRIEQGLALLQVNESALEAFRFMNRAMWYQRTHTIYSEKVRRGEKVDFAKEDIPKNQSWRPFQIAFVLLNLPGITLLDHSERSTSENAVADLLFFPTGGGKTEAYLGLTAYTMGLRRLQGIVGGRRGDEGVAVLMRYTLRLLTIQQFQRATALICACESIRRKALENGDSCWGTSPFRIGLWVGKKTTPNYTKDAAEAIKQAKGNGNAYYRGGGTPYQLTTCPWCGSPINVGEHLEAHLYPQESARTITYCGDKTGQCLFSRRQANGEGLPIVVVDEEIYRRLPSLLIATVDKFAQMPWRGEVQMLFGQVQGYCERHGFTSPEIEDSDHQRTKLGLSSTKIKPEKNLRPPDLIIQDELHLISGPLGTLVGLYETAIDKLCTWEVNGRKVRPKLIASTATIKNADVQVRSLFLRTVNIFPAAGLDVDDNFFSIQRKPTEEHFGRRYLGICASGRRLKAALIRVYVAFLCASQFLYEKYGKAADPWMTLVGYFNSKRELGGMRRLADDDVRSRCQKQDRRGLSKRWLNCEFLKELTSRMRSEDIPKILDRMEAVFDPEIDARRKESIKNKQKDTFKDLPQKPLDVLLATNMISVGVDVKRLGVMIVGGQPKSTAEYIQATSRVGRSYPGLICTVFNWARPRDLSHYETIIPPFINTSSRFP